MYLKSLEINGFKSFAKKTELNFDTPITAIVGPNGSGKSNVAESLRWVLGEQSMKSLRGKKGEDLIFNGSKGNPRLNKASVTITFDNSKKIFDVDFDEVSIKREVHRDGTNEYYINNSQVRLKDVYELLSQVSIGASSHHIISQGEADRILSANIKERRGMIEDALGLKIFQYKKNESERKLAKTEENIKEAESLRRELAPEIRYLKKQVEEIEKVKELKDELKNLYQKYFSIEDAVVNGLLERNFEEKREQDEIREQLNKELEGSQVKIADSEDTDRKEYRILADIETEMRSLSSQKDNEVRSLGRIEGMLEVVSEEKELTYVERTDDGNRRCKYCRQNISDDHEHIEVDKIEAEKRRKFEAEKRAIEDTIKSLEEKEKELVEKKIEVQKTIDEALSSVREAERGMYDLKSRLATVNSRIEKLIDDRRSLEDRLERFKRDQGEAGIILGERILFDRYIGDINSAEIRVGQEDKLKKIERLKIRIEDSGGSDRDILGEYEEVIKRDEHIASEIADLEKSAQDLKELMADLAKTLESRFENGLNRINSAFNKYFGILFGGGEAKLIVQKESKRKTEVEEMLEGPTEEEESYGVGISVNLPRKKIRGLDMLSGGERALTSIALLFAMSQVNPPPFLVLDETDAALDEANSRKYGDMVESLSKHSQLIVITHNRETMGRAHVLYGVTMSSDSVSKLLSIKFAEAENYAK